MEAHWFIKDESELQDFIRQTEDEIKVFASDPARDKNWLSDAAKKECENRRRRLWQQVDRWHEANKKP